MSERQKILIVDDEVDQLEIIREWLAETYDVTAVGSPALALKAIETTRYDLMVTDFSMPEMNGAQLASKITKMPQLSSMPVIMLTGIQDDLAITVIKSIPRIKFVQKPIRKAEFLPIVEEMLKVLH